MRHRHDRPHLALILSNTLIRQFTVSRLKLLTRSSLLSNIHQIRLKMHLEVIEERWWPRFATS